MSQPIISLIAAMNRQRVIGDQGGMPWHLPADLRHFRLCTEGKPIIMGRKTFESIGRALPKRRNLVLSRGALALEGVECFTSLEQAINACNAQDEVMVIGGGEIYRQALPAAERLYLTRIDNDLPGDTCFPEFDPQQWQRIELSTHPADERHAWPMQFETWQRKA